jgi:hypothetical protein
VAQNKEKLSINSKEINQLALNSNMLALFLKSVYFAPNECL